jgi:hypothetical protein
MIRLEMKLEDVVAEIDGDELTLARLVFAHAEHAALRPSVIAHIEERMRASYEEGSYAFLNLIECDDAMPSDLRRTASSHVFSLDHRPAGPDHRAFIRIHGAQSIDDIED